MYIRELRVKQFAQDRLHYLSDVTLNSGVILALFLSYYGYKWADGLFAALIGLFIFKGAYTIGIGAVQTLLDKTLDVKSLTKIIKCVAQEKGVKSFHDLKAHSAGPMVYIQGHLVMDGSLSLEKLMILLTKLSKISEKISLMLKLSYTWNQMKNLPMTMFSLRIVNIL